MTLMEYNDRMANSVESVDPDQTALVAEANLCQGSRSDIVLAGSVRIFISLEAYLSTYRPAFDLHYAIIGLKSQFLVFLRVDVLDRFYYIVLMSVQYYHF